MNSITNFNFRGADVRTIVLPNGEPGFVGKDVAERLGYADTSDAIKRHCKGSVIRLPLPTAGGMQQMRILTRTKRQAPGFSPGSSVQAGTACCCSMY